MELVKLIAETTMETKIDRTLAGMITRKIERSMEIKNQYNSRAASRYYNKIIENDIICLAKGGYTNLAMKYALTFLFN